MLTTLKQKIVYVDDLKKLISDLESQVITLEQKEFKEKRNGNLQNDAQRYKGESIGYTRAINQIKKIIDEKSYVYNSQ